MQLEKLNIGPGFATLQTETEAAAVMSQCIVPTDLRNHECP